MRVFGSSVIVAFVACGVEVQPTAEPEERREALDDTKRSAVFEARQTPKQTDDCLFPAIRDSVDADFDAWLADGACPHIGSAGIRQSSLWGDPSVAGIRTVSGNISLRSGESGDASMLVDLERVDGDLELESRRIPPLRHLDRVGGRLRVTGAGVFSFRGLKWLREIGGGLEVVSSETFVGLEGLEGVTDIGGGITLQALPLVVTLDGLSGLKRLGGDLYVEDLADLDNMDGLLGLEAFSGRADFKSLPRVRMDSYCRVVTHLHALGATNLDDSAVTAACAPGASPP